MPAAVQLTIVVDNQAGDGLVAEHGLAIWIEVDDLRILFDTGQGGALPPNVTRLGLPIERADALVLSHGHYDHTGGVPFVLERAPAVQVWFHPALNVRRFSIRNGTARSIGMPPTAITALAEIPASRAQPVRGAERLADGVGLTGPIPRSTAYEDTGGPFYLDRAGRRPDPLDDDQALWIATPRGLVVCLGCGHAGLVNTLEQARRASGIERVHAVVGGFHLLEASAERLEQTIDVLRALAPEVVVPLHCTGERATQVLAAALGQSVIAGRSGLELAL